MKEGSEGPMWILGERKFQAQKTASAQALRLDCAWSAGRTAGRTGCLDGVSRWDSKK